MSDPFNRDRRVTADELGGPRLLKLSLVLAQIGAALQPARLAVALCMVVVLHGTGELLDAVRTDESIVRPDGLLGASVVTTEDPAVQVELRRVLESARAIGVQPPVVPDGRTTALDPSEVRARVIAGYAEHRRSHASGAARAADDRRYLEVLAAVDRYRPRGLYAELRAAMVASWSDLVRAAGRIDLFEGLEALRAAGIRLPVAVWRADPWFGFLYGLVVLIVVAIGGGTLARMSACEIGARQRRSVRGGLLYGLRWSRPLLMSLLLPPTLIGLLALVPTAIGGLLAVPWLDVVGGLLAGIGVLAAVLAAILVFAVAIGWSLLLPAVVCEGCDAGEAVQRVTAYVFNRPMHVVGYAAAGTVGFVLGTVVVAFVAATALDIAAGSLGAIHAPPSLVGFWEGEPLAPLVTDAGPLGESAHAEATAWLLGAWRFVLLALVAAYALAYVFSASTAVYLLLREVADGQDVEEVWMPEGSQRLVSAVDVPVGDEDRDAG